MIGPILQAIANQVGPLVNQLFQSASPLLQQVPRHFYIIGGRMLSEKLDRAARSWYRSLSPEAKANVDRAIYCVIKDGAGDLATYLTGLPIKPLVNEVFDRVEEYRDVPAARDYVETTLKEQLKVHKEVSGALDEKLEQKISSQVTMVFSPIVDGAKCIGCEECVDVCPGEVFEMQDGKSVSVNAEECMGCEACIEVCPEDAIVIKEY